MWTQFTELRGKNCQKMAKIALKFLVLQKIFLLKHSHMPKNAAMIISFTLFM